MTIHDYITNTIEVITLVPNTILSGYSKVSAHLRGKLDTKKYFHCSYQLFTCGLTLIRESTDSVLPAITSPLHALSTSLLELAKFAAPSALKGTMEVTIVSATGLMIGDTWGIKKYLFLEKIGWYELMSAGLSDPYAILNPNTKHKSLNKSPTVYKSLNPVVRN